MLSVATISQLGSMRAIHDYLKPVELEIPPLLIASSVRAAGKPPALASAELTTKPRPAEPDRALWCRVSGRSVGQRHGQMIG